MIKAIIPAGSEAAVAELKLSPAVVSGEHVFLTGMTGSLPDGTVPELPKEQFHRAFEKIGTVLQEAGVGYDAIVEMTSYHVAMSAHFEVFNEVRASYLSAPYPAWTAVEVAGLRRAGALVEIRVIASRARSA